VSGGPPAAPSLRANLLGGVVGNVLEWYDFAVYGYFAPVIASQFFPSRSRFASLLGAFGAFAGAYFMRPLGGALFGNLGDRLGRKTALQLSVMMMALPTMLIGLLPTHASAGALAAVLLVGLRLLQGLSVGGELVGSISFITEIAPRHRRGYFGSFSLCSSTAGVMLGSLVALALQESLAPAQLQAWGWRLPFLSGLVIGVVGLWMRQGMDETPHFQRLKREGGLKRSPVREVLQRMPGRVAVVAGLVVLTGGGFYMLFVWWPTFLRQLVEPPIPHALVVNSLAMLALMLGIPAAGWLSDELGRRSLVILAAGGLALAAYPLFSLVDHGSFLWALLAQLAFALLMSGVTGPMPALMVELFPASTRYSGVAVGYNISLALFGGTAPLVCTWIVGATDSVVAPAYYLVFLALVTLVSALALAALPPLDEPLDTPRRARPGPPVRMVYPMPPPEDDS
jgi:MHS family proline/betaine transporter-like MFS transporter